MDYTQEQVNEIVAEAKRAAYEAAQRYFAEKMNNQDQMCCGFAWTSILGVKGNTKLGKMLKAAGVTQSYDKSFQIWNPSGMPVQNIDCKEIGARAAAAVFQKHGFKAYAGSRLD